jgi:hypothetical protein
MGGAVIKQYRCRHGLITLRALSRQAIAKQPTVADR